jgi:hypothetical protein
MTENRVEKKTVAHKNLKKYRKEWFFQRKFDQLE